MDTNKIWLKSFDNERLEIIVFVTEQCNFRCLYCYEDFKVGKISSEIILGIKNLILARIHKIKELSLSYFGGEPLLNKSVVLELSDWASKLCKENNVYYFGSLTTNAYGLDKITFKKLIRSKVKSFQITLDGEKEEHNKLRPTINGKNTFEKIYSNLVSMSKSKHDFSCVIRFNVSDTNIYSVESFILNNSFPFSNDRRFNFHFHPIFGMENLKLSKNELLYNLKKIAISKGLFFNSEEGESTCYAAKANSFVIRADGRVQKCTVALESDINNIGKISKDGILKLDQYKLKKWLFANDKECPVQSLKLEKLIVPYENAGKYMTNKI
ncbi:4Fe-4S cluster-binding domain-containing protein [Flavobacterium jejuense]|uniref:4Fe-4S cluster-binding domain-containing protein n=1 Tax=Flavobacterium jejuense TaxID=1544455 RepID=A0ABX0ISM7_9FLAO|nr:radical SAM protein [Flavobacterium jejuense]NHN26872.1 4Fe-4S cluster-binding domain-containing protein [Flavobacterium jejuense]